LFTGVGLYGSPNLAGFEILLILKKVFFKIESLAPAKCGNSIEDKFYISGAMLQKHNFFTLPCRNTIFSLCP